MSYTTLLATNKRGNLECIAEYSNSHGFAACIWDYLFDKYIEKKNDYDSWLFDAKRLWDLQKDHRLEEFERISLLVTFDNVMIRCKYKDVVVDALSEMYEAVKRTKPENVNNLRTICEDIKKLKGQRCFCFIATSVNGDAWTSDRCYKNGESRNYNIFKDKKHWFLFEQEDK